MSNHTPGPWEAKRDESHFGSLSTVEGGDRMKHKGLSRELVVQVGGWASLTEQEASTRLIAAAPELLEVVMDIVSDCKGMIQPGLYELAVKAFAKAEGRTL